MRSQKPAPLGVIIFLPALVLAMSLFCVSGVVFAEKTKSTADTQVDQAFVPSSQMYQNPMEPDIPDPYIFRASDGRYYAYGTTGFNAWSSTDLVHWRSEGVVYRKTAASWGAKDFWAPEVVEYAGKFYLFYTASPANSDSKRIGVATSDKPTGPFIDVYNHPIFDFGYGVIDPNVFIDDDGRKYLYFSRAASEYVVNGRKESNVYVIELTDDLITVKGDPVPLTKPDQFWELSNSMRWNEGPAVFKRNGIYYLMYSSNCYCNRNYAVGYATAKSPLGPFVKYKYNPILSAAESGNRVSGPGHNSVVLSPDGTEWYIAYHTHIDPVAGGGPRQLNIDRMGFRADGSIYVNGPSITPQPTPSGNTDLRNIAPEAIVTASSTKTGYSTNGIIDGEIGFYSRYETNDWASADEGAGAWVQLTWSEPRRLQSILIYDSAMRSRKITEGHVVFSDGTVVDNIVFPTEQGSAAIVSAPDKDITWVRFIADKLADNEGTVSLSEIMAIGYPQGTIWMDSPTANSSITSDVPIILNEYKSGLKNLQIALDGQTIYQGTSLPRSLNLQFTKVPSGKHELTVTAETAGGAKQLSTPFEVKHIQFDKPDDMAILRGTVAVRALHFWPEEQVKHVAILLVPGMSLTNKATNASEMVLYEGQRLPAQMDFDTLKVADGTYLLRIALTTKTGEVTSVEHEVLIENWTVLEDELLPPSSGWFGVQDNTHIQQRSNGWEFVASDPQSFFNDSDRLQRIQNTSEYLVWELPALYAYQFVVYTRQLDIKQSVGLSISADAHKWTPLPLTVQASEQSTSGWWKLTLAGTTSLNSDYKFIRISVSGDTKPEDIQLGYVTLSGVAK